MHVLAAVAQRPDARLREIAEEVGISERATHRIVCDLVDQGYLTRSRVGSRNRYEVHPDAPLRHPMHVRYTSRHLLALLAEPETAADGGAVSAAGVSPDEQSELLCEAFLAAPVGVVVCDADGRFVAVNRAYGDILGYAPEELVGRRFRDFTHPDDIAGDEQALSELVAGQRTTLVRQKRNLHRDGSTVWVQLTVATTERPRTGESVFVTHVVDISHRKRQEQTLAEAEERFRSAFDNAPIGMALVAPDGRWLKVNRSLCELTGYAETQLLMGSFQAITHPADLDADLALLEDVLAGRRRTYQMEKRYYRSDGRVIWAMLSVSLVRDAAGEPLYFVSQIEDITDRKERERSVQHQAQQLVELVAAGGQVENGNGATN
jgi:PAS domain S-box-containing protein